MLSSEDDAVLEAAIRARQQSQHEQQYEAEMSGVRPEVHNHHGSWHGSWSSPHGSPHSGKSPMAHAGHRGGVGHEEPWHYPEQPSNAASQPRGTCHRTLLCLAAFLGMVLSAIDVALHLIAASVAQSFYEGANWFTNAVYGFVILSLIVTLLCIVCVVGRASSSQTVDGSALQRKMHDAFEKTGVLLLLSVVHPPFLFLVLPASYATAIIVIDAVRSLVEGLPFLPLAISFLLREGFPGGATTLLTVSSLGWTAITLVLKLFAVFLAVLLAASTRTLRRELEVARRELLEERRARADEQAELASYREHYYGGGYGGGTSDGLDVVAY